MLVYQRVFCCEGTTWLPSASITMCVLKNHSSSTWRTPGGSSWEIAGWRPCLLRGKHGKTIGKPYSPQQSNVTSWKSPLYGGFNGKNMKNIYKRRIFLSLVRFPKHSTSRYPSVLSCKFEYKIYHQPTPLSLSPSPSPAPTTYCNLFISTNFAKFLQVSHCGILWSYIPLYIQQMVGLCCFYIPCFFTRLPIAGLPRYISYGQYRHFCCCALPC